MDYYPMKTTIDGVIVRNLWLVAGEHSATVWRWDRDADAAVILRQSPQRATRVGASQSWAVDDLVLDPQRGCGCQHPMYSFVPPLEASR